MSDPEIHRPQRWSVPFADELEGSAMSENLVDELLDGSLAALKRDVERFPPRLPVKGILRNDCRLRVFKPGDVILRKGDYGNSAYYILDGGVRIVLSTLPGEMLETSGSSERKSVVRMLASALFGYRQRTEVRNLKKPFDVRKHRAARVQLSDIPDFLIQQIVDDDGVGVDTAPESGVDEGFVGEATSDERGQIGEIFGDIAAMGRTPRTSTVVAGPRGARLLEIRWQGLREIRKYSPSWRETLDERYRRFSLKWFLRDAELTAGLRKEPSMEHDGRQVSTLDYVAERTQFHSYGEFDWQEAFKSAAATAKSASDRLDIEPVIVEQGSHPHSLVMIRSGFVRVRHKYNHGEKTVSYLGKGSVIGMLEIYYNWKQRTLGAKSDRSLLSYSETCSAIGYVDTLSIPVPVVEDVIIPSLSDGQRAELDRRIADIERERNREAKLDAKLMEFMVEERGINGSAAMLIDLDRCTRCDDCVRACATTHDNNPRFIRQGPEQSGIQLTHACMHCADPLCLFGCPTGAIHRSDDGERVVINDFTCIGCSTCADNCPYGNIQMVEIRDTKDDVVPGTVRDEEGLTVVRRRPDESPIRKATKCDLCEGSLTGPACEYACPHDALIRVNLQQPEPLVEWLERR